MNSSSCHKGKTARQIAETKRSKKSLYEFNTHQEWEHSLTPLMKACRGGDINKVIDIIDSSGDEIFALDSNGGNALYWAVVGGNLELLQKLLQAGLDVHMRTKKGETLLHVTCMMRQHHMVAELVLAHQVDPTLKDRTYRTCQER